MSEFAQSFGKNLLKMIWVFSKHLFICAAFSILTLSVVTGKFPPPLKESYHSLKELKNIVNIGENTSAFAKAKLEREKVLKELDEIDRQPASLESPSKSDAPSGARAVENAADRIRSLEYEVASLKSKLQSSRAEADELRAKLPPDVNK